MSILEVLREQFNADIQIIHVQKDIDKMNKEREEQEKAKEKTQ